MNANDATLTRLATARTGSTAGHPAPNAPAASSFDLILQAAAGSALGGSGTPYTMTISAIDLTSVTQGWPTLTLHQSFDAASGWKPSGTGQGYQCTQTFPVPVPGGGPGARWHAVPATSTRQACVTGCSPKSAEARRVRAVGSVKANRLPTTLARGCGPRTTRC